MRDNDNKLLLLFGKLMVDSRNKTSHIYHEKMAEEIAHDIPHYYELLKSVADRLFDKK